jgi:hypothetical protein
MLNIETPGQGNRGSTAKAHANLVSLMGAAHMVDLISGPRPQVAL